MGYAGGVGQASTQPLAANGFAAYGLVSATGLTLQTDQLPVVGNFDNVSICDTFYVTP
jgi:hypothetical protein